MTPLHIAIIGGGAAGYFCAIEAKRNYPVADITIFEKNQKMLAKVAITGGGRCNLTNSFEQISDTKHAYPRGDKLMKRLYELGEKGRPDVVQMESQVAEDEYNLTHRRGAG